MAVVAEPLEHVCVFWVAACAVCDVLCLVGLLALHFLHVLQATHISFNAALCCVSGAFLFTKVFGGCSFGGRFGVACSYMVCFHMLSICFIRGCQDLL